mgnify:CR=1 FL=1
MVNNNLFHGRYFLERLLGRGNFSEVWLAKDDKTESEVALKIYAPATGLDEHGVNVLAREFAIVLNANHKNLLKPLYYDTYERKPYLVLPYCKNGSIQRRVGQFSEDEAWHLLHDVASGLAFLHAMKPTVIHQDIKPDNIMVDNNGSYMITDFGVSAHAKSTLRKSMSIKFASAGTTAYMAPERFSKDNTPIMANDIWSLGAMTYEMITGEVPFTAGHLEGGILQKNGAEIPELSEAYSPQLNTLIGMCLSLNPWDRPTAEQVESYARIAIGGGDPFPKPKPWYVKFKVPLVICTSLLIALLIIWGVVSYMKTEIIIDGPELEGVAKAANLMKSSSTSSEGLALLNDLVEQNDADATYLLSRLYFKSKSPSDICPDSIRLMQNSLGITPDNSKAHELLIKALELNPNNYYGLYELGCDFLGGDARTDVVKRDVKKADKYFRDGLSLAKDANDEYYIELIQQQIEKYENYINDYE